MNSHFIRCLGRAIVGLVISAILLQAQGGEPLGEMVIGTVRYLPSENGEFESNEVENTSPALGPIYLETDLSTLFSRALKQTLPEYRLAHVGPVAVNVTIERVSIDWDGLEHRTAHVAVSFAFTRGGEMISEERMARDWPLLRRPDTDSALELLFGRISHQLVLRLIHPAAQ